jgi:ribonuclease P protein component
MFAKKSEIKSLGRLKKRSDFLWVQQNPDTRKWVSKSMIIELCPNDDLGVRYGLTVSKRVSKLAVLRNRTKRRLKAVACDVLPKFSDHNIDIVLIGRVSTAEQDYATLKRDFLWCLRKLGYERND